MVRDRRWGRETDWNCKFWDDVHLIPRSTNKDSVAKLLRGFFEFYTTTFDWANQAVSIRLPFAGAKSKFNLYSSVHEDQWYVEDPFDLRHNLASQCTREGRQRILERMGETLGKMKSASSENVLSEFEKHSTPVLNSYLLKCRVHTEKVSASDFVEALRAARDVGRFVVKFPVNTPGSRAREVMDAFAVFKMEGDRRRVHRLNETYISEWQLRLLPCSSWALEDAMKSGEYDELEATPREPAEGAEAGGPCQQVQEDEADEAAKEVRNGLRAARNENEVKVLIQRAQALNLNHEVDLGKHKLRQLQESGMSARTEGSLAGDVPAHTSPALRSTPSPSPPSLPSPPSPPSASRAAPPVAVAPAVALSLTVS